MIWISIVSKESYVLRIYWTAKENVTFWKNYWNSHHCKFGSGNEWTMFDAAIESLEYIRLRYEVFVYHGGTQPTSLYIKWL